MEILKTFFPLSFAAKESKDLINLIVCGVIGLIVCAVVGKLLGWIPLVGLLVGIVLGLASLYIVITLILGVLVFLNIIQ